MILGRSSFWELEAHWGSVEKRKAKTTPFGINLMRRPVLSRAAQGGSEDCLLNTAGQAATSNCSISNKSA